MVQGMLLEEIVTLRAKSFQRVEVIDRHTSIIM